MRNILLYLAGKRKRNFVTKEAQDQSTGSKRTMTIATLPNEMLSCIFEECVEGDTGGPGGEGLGSSPRTLALVCRKWYRITSATASLWGTILVTDIPDNYWTIQRNWRLPATEKTKSVSTHSAMQVCTTEQALKRALQRSKGASLDITIGLKITNFDQDRLPFVSRIYKTLFSKRIGLCITRLTLDPRPASIIWEVFSCGRRPTAVHLPNLVSVTNVSSKYIDTCADSVLSLVLDNAGNLKDISLIGTELSTSLVPSWEGAEYSFQNLRRLSVEYGQMLDQMFQNIMPIPELVIQQAAQIECFGEADVCSIQTYPWPIRSTDQFTFTRVTSIHLILDDLSLLSKIDFPVLESLRLSQSSKHLPGINEPVFNPDFIINLPRLRSLRTVTDKFAQLRRFQMPPLESLHLTSTRITTEWTDPDILSLFPEFATQIEPLAEEPRVALDSPSFPSLKSVHTLHINAEVSEGAILQVLKSLPLLRVLRLVPGQQLGEDLVQGLTAKASEGPSTLSSILCPNLAVVELDLFSFIKWKRTRERGVRVGTTTLTTLPTALENCVASRRNAGRPLQRCTVIDQQGKREYAHYDV
jgi:hypothetical protein